LVFLIPAYSVIFSKVHFDQRCSRGGEELHELDLGVNLRGSNSGCIAMKRFNQVELWLGLFEQ